jgi:hypothetical protein
MYEFVFLALFGTLPKILEGELEKWWLNLRLPTASTSTNPPHRQLEAE